MLVASVWLACAAAPEVAAPPVAVSDRGAILRRPGEQRSEWAGALCNDGTPFAYVHRAGVEATWVIHLEGGYFCDDGLLPCAERARKLTTTRPGRDGDRVRWHGAGILSRDPAVNPLFAAAHHVEGHYCSSDAWLGDRLDRQPNSADPAVGWYFNGRENVRVLFESLKAVGGLDEADAATRVLVVGSSAGALGVVGNLDQILAAFPRAADEGRVKVLIDAGWITPFRAATPRANVARWGAIDRACALREPDARVCAFGPNWWPTAAATGLPILIQVSGQDTAQTQTYGIRGPEDRAAWQDAVRSSLDGVPWVFSSGAAYHVLAIDGPRFARATPEVDFREVLERFWRGDPPERVFVDYAAFGR